MKSARPTNVCVVLTRVLAQSGVTSLTEATPHHDQWFLFVDEFDPHEPFDTPAPNA